MQHPSDEQATNTADSGEPRDVCAVGDARSKASEDNGTGGGEKGRGCDSGPRWQRRCVDVEDEVAVGAHQLEKRAGRPPCSTKHNSITGKYRREFGLLAQTDKCRFGRRFRRRFDG